MSGDGVKTIHFWSRVFSVQNAIQVSSVAGIGIAAAGQALGNTPNLYAQVGGALLTVLGGALIGHPGTMTVVGPND